MPRGMRVAIFRQAEPHRIVNICTVPLYIFWRIQFPLHKKVEFKCTTQQNCTQLTWIVWLRPGMFSTPPLTILHYLLIFSKKKLREVFFKIRGLKHLVMSLVCIMGFKSTVHVAPIVEYLLLLQYEFYSRHLKSIKNLVKYMMPLELWGVIIWSFSFY